MLSVSLAVSLFAIAAEGAYLNQFHENRKKKTKNKSKNKQTKTIKNMSQELDWSLINDLCEKRKAWSIKKKHSENFHNYPQVLLFSIRMQIALVDFGVVDFGATLASACIGMRRGHVA